jgi:predicted dehydrogenase
MADEASSLRFVIVGGGSIGKRHLGNLQALGATHIVVVDPVAERLREIAEKFGVKTSESFAATLEAGADAVLICSPTSLHLEQALMAARAGCHLFIEKPIAETLARTDELLAEIERRSLHSLVGCNFRFHPGLQRVKTLLAERAIGNVVSARAQFGQYLPDWHPWEDYRLGYSASRAKGGGVVLDRIHEIDYIQWLLGDVAEVFAWLGQLSHLEIDTEDTAEILLRFADGPIGSVHLDYVRRTYDCSLEIVGDLGTIQWRFAPHEVRWSNAATQSSQELAWPWYAANEMYLEQTKHWLRVLEGREVSLQDCRSALVPLKIALAAKQAAMTGRSVALKTLD